MVGFQVPKSKTYKFPCWHEIIWHKFILLNFSGLQQSTLVESWQNGLFSGPKTYKFPRWCEIILHKYT